MSLIKNNSVIVPSNHGHHELMRIVRAVCDQTIKPSGIVIVGLKLHNYWSQRMSL
jgi:hypothetical protein